MIYLQRTIAFIVLALIVWLPSAMAQNPYTVETRPPRGFMPAADQLTSPVDSIDPVSRKLHLEIPLASLPPGPAGSGFDLNLVYDSHLYDLFPEILEPPPYLPNEQPIVASRLEGHSSGGWHYNIENLGFDVETHSGAKEYPDCPSGSPVRVYRLRVGLLDGSLHTMQLRGRDAEPTYYGDGFFEINPMTGMRNSCNLDWPQPVTGWLSYYSTDGSYLKLERYMDGSQNYASFPFYIYFPDGRRATGHGWTVEALYDANGNGIHFVNGCNDPCSQPYRAIVDDSGREIRILYNSENLPLIYTSETRTDSITAAGPNGVRITTVNWMNLVIGEDGRNYFWANENSWDPYRPLSMVLPVVKYVQLPLSAAVASNQTPPVWNSYAFGYADDADDGYGEVDSVRTPTGSLFQYRYQMEGGVQYAESIAANNGVRERKIMHDGIADLKWTYTSNAFSTVIANPDGTSTVYSFWPQGNYVDSGVPSLLSVVYRIDEPNGVVRKRVWSQNVVPGTSFYAAQNPWIRRETTTIGNAAGAPSLTSVMDRMIDKNGNLLQTTEYDWVSYSASGPETGAAPKRITQWAYYASVPDATSLSYSEYEYWNPPFTGLTYGSVRRLDAVRRKEVSDGAGSKAAIAEFYYANPYGNGNVTSELHWDSVKSVSAPALGALSASNSQVLTRTYDGFGNVTDFYEPQIRTHITYDGSGSVPTRVDYGYASAQQRSWGYDWNVSAGTLNSKTDLDNNITTTFTYDAVGRPRITMEAGLRKTETIYDDANLVVTVKKDLNTLGDGKLQVSTQYDQLGRSVLSRSSEPGNADGIKVKSAYYPLLNRTVHSSPYRTTSDATLEWTCTQSDASKRVIAVAIFKGAEPNDCASPTNRTGVTSTVYDADQATITDPASKQNRKIVDGLGRLKQLIEDPSGLNYSTTYAYDTLGYLTQVNQGEQIRTFNYSSLGRLLQAQNPESGIISYSYYDSGDLLKRTDARGIDTTHTYDAVHRILTKSYSNQPVGVTTPNVTYSYYDAGSSVPNIGQLQSMTSSAATVNYGSYDVLGRMGTNTQITNGNGYTFLYTYRLNDTLSSMQYPSGKTVNYAVDDAGRVNQITAGTKIYADLPASYAPFTADGRIAYMKLGNDLWESRIYQTPGSPTLLKLGTANDTSDKLELEYDYSETANNGNLVRQFIRQPEHTWQQDYTYDALNRIKTASETNGFNRTYDYDRYGNRWVAASSGITTYEPHEPTAGTLFNTADNRLANQDYDAAGNQTYYAPRTLVYDAENRMISATSTSNGNESYLYDGDGRRVKKTWTPNGGATLSTTYVYGPAGRLAAEYTNQISATTGTSWMFVDLLGSVRAVTGEKPQSGTAPMTECYDYLPFGRILSANDNGRNTGCYPSTPDFALSSVESQKFTGQVRDVETGLDYFGARYFSGAQGRFTSPDPLLNSGRPWQPQSWNRYSYTLNNPLRYTDPTGLYEWDKNCKDNDTTCQLNRQQFRDALSNLKQAASTFAEGSKQRNQLNAILTKIGTEGDKNKTRIAFDDDMKDLGRTFGNKMTFNFQLLGDLLSQWDAGTVSTAAAGVVGHEGQHLVDGTGGLSGIRYLLNMGNERVKKEIQPFTVESYVFQGFNKLEPLGFGLGVSKGDSNGWPLWNPSWAPVDAEKLRTENVQRVVEELYGKKK